MLPSRAGAMATNEFYRDGRQVRVAERLFRLVGPGAAAFFGMPVAIWRPRLGSRLPAIRWAI